MRREPRDEQAFVDARAQPVIEIQTHFQPIVELEAGTVVGYEALSRGPRGELECPRALFGWAARHGIHTAVDGSCLSAALVRARDLPEDDRAPLVFVNVLPSSLLDPTFLSRIEAAMGSGGLPPSRVVLEITEGQQVADYELFRRRMAPYRERGFQIALDDVGAGHAGLQMFIELEPDLVKLDRSLVRGINADARREALIEGVVLVARRAGLRVIAEGIETADELRALRGLGIAWGQGYFLGRPASAATKVDAAAVRVLTDSARGKSAVAADEVRPAAASIGALISTPPLASRESSVREALEVFESSAVDALVVLEGESPWGIVQRGRLMEMLSRPFGRELYLRKPLEDVAETALMLVEADQSLEEVSRRAMARSEHAVYSHIVVVEGGRYRGVVSVRQLLDAMTDARVQLARYANPLTGLPGNPAIEAVIRARLQNREILGVLHADLDFFKAFNDRYGFHRGDDAIRFTAQVMEEVLSRLGGEDAFLGHVGGDDFVAIVTGEHVEAIAVAIRQQFRAGVGHLYPDLDRTRGYVFSSSRSGEPQCFPLMDVTVATTVVSGADATHYAHVLDTLAERKRTAKKRAKRGLLRLG